MKIQDTIISMILQNKTNAEIVKTVLEVHQGSRTTSECVSWYRSKLKKNLKENKGRYLKYLPKMSREDEENWDKEFSNVDKKLYQTQTIS